MKQSLHPLQSPVASPKHGRPSSPTAAEDGPGRCWKSERSLIVTCRGSLELIVFTMFRLEFADNNPLRALLRNLHENRVYTVYSDTISHHKINLQYTSVQLPNFHPSYSGLCNMHAAPVFLAPRKKYRRTFMAIANAHLFELFKLVAATVS